MKRFKEFLVEVFLLEGKIDDLKAQNPGLHREIDQYASADTSTTKKFVPWLVSQHKRGNVTPDHPDLHQTIQNFDRYKNLHGIKDHSNRSFQEVRDAVVPLVGKGATKAEIAYEGREKIHDSGDVQAYHVKTKEASQHFYGGGPEAGPTNTTWCTSARSKKCAFGEYGKMYTIHSKGDPNSPYAVHPEENTITNRHNDGDRDIEQEIQSRPEVAQLKSVIDLIQKYHDPFVYHLKTSNHISDNEIDRVMAGNTFHKKALMKNSNPHVVLTALNHPQTDNQITQYAVQHPSSHVALAAINHPQANERTLWHGTRHPNPQVALAAMNHQHATNETMWQGAQNPNLQVALAAMDHPLADHRTTWSAVENKNAQIALAAINHPNADDMTLQFGSRHPNSQVALAAINHPKVDARGLMYGAQHSNPQVALAAINHPKANTVVIDYGTRHPDLHVQSVAKTKMAQKAIS